MLNPIELLLCFAATISDAMSMRLRKRFVQGVVVAALMAMFVAVAAHMTWLVVVSALVLAGVFLSPTLREAG